MNRLSVVTLNESLLDSQDASLRQQCRTINVSDDVDMIYARRVIAEMFRVLYSDCSGVAIAAPQIGIQVKIAIVDFQDRETNQSHTIALINPTYNPVNDECSTAEEICLSVPNFAGKVQRSEHVLVNAYDQNGGAVEFEATGFFARVVQHEVDHLNGVLYVDRLDGALKQVPDYPERRTSPTLKKLGIRLEKAEMPNKQS